MLRALVLVAVLGGSARADFGEQLEGELGPPDAVFIASPPPELTRDIPLGRVEQRVAMFDAAIVRATHPHVRAQLLLMRADLWAARGIAERVASLESIEFSHDIAASKAIKRAVADYDKLYRAPVAGWRHMDRALAHYGFLLSFDRRPLALEVMDRLVDEFPASPFAPYAHVVLGDARSGTAALVHYDAVTAPPKVRLYALYRASWILLDRDPALAFAKLSEAIAIEPTGMLAWQLRRRAVRAFSKFGAPADAHAAFARTEPERALEMLDDLAGRWNDAGQTAKALATFSELVRRAPGDPRACGWQAAATAIVFKLNDNALYFRHAERLVRIFERERVVRDDPDCETAVTEFTLGVAGDASTNKALARQLYDLVLHALPDRRVR